MTQSFAFNPHASQATNEDFVKTLHQRREQDEPLEGIESKPVINLKPRRQRARAEEGKFAADNPETPQNEAWQE